MSDPGLKIPARPRTLFPLIRHLSRPVTMLLLKTPFTANQATFISLLFGLFAAYCFFEGGYRYGILGGVFLFLNYLLDNCDGEIARAKNLSSRFGHEFETVVDWVVHTALFAAMGQGAHAQTGQIIWLWFGLAAAAGGTINYALSLYWKWRDGLGEFELVMVNPDAGAAAEYKDFKTVLIVAFRELARADFWAIVLALALLDWMRYLLPLAAVGAQVYWILGSTVRDEDHHV